MRRRLLDNLTGPLGLDASRKWLHLFGLWEFSLHFDLRLAGEDDGILVMHIFVGGRDGRQLRIGNVELLVDAVEKCFAEGATGEVVHDTVEESHTG